jgi:hypothetical protein
MTSWRRRANADSAGTGRRDAVVDMGAGSAAPDPAGTGLPRCPVGPALRTLVSTASAVVVGTSSRGAAVPDPVLSRHAGAVALAAGVLFVVLDLGRYPSNYDRLAMAADPLLMAVNAAYFFAFVGLMVALVALHGRLAADLGRFGLVAFLAAVLGVMTQGGNMWFDGFAAPWIAEVAPQAIAAEKTITLQVGALSAYLLFALGWMLFGIALLRARVVPVAVPLGVVVGGVLGFQSGLPPFGIPLGLAVAAVGAALIRTTAPASAPEGVGGHRE